MVSLRVSLRLEENFWLEEISEGNFSCRRRVAEKNVVIVTTIENAISLYDTLRKTKTLYKYGIKVSLKKFIKKHIQNTLMSYEGRRSIDRFNSF